MSHGKKLPTPSRLINEGVVDWKWEVYLAEVRYIFCVNYFKQFNYILESCQINGSAPCECGLSFWSLTRRFISKYAVCKFGHSTSNFTYLY